MRSFTNNYEKILEVCYLDAKVKYKGMTEEWYRQTAEENVDEYQMSILETNLLYNLREKGSPEYRNRKLAHKLVYELPTELHQNLEEWIDEQPISEIKYGDTSIKEIMETYSKMGRNVSFVGCCESMIDYIQNDCIDKSFCYHRYEVM